MENTNSNGINSCPSCLTANTISADFCSNCGHAIGNFVNLDPIGQVKSQGHLFREAANKPRSPIILTGFWVYFGITIIGITLVLFYSFQEFPFLLNLLFIGMAILGGAILYKATRNYLKRN